MNKQVSELVAMVEGFNDTGYIPSHLDVTNGGIFMVDGVLRIHSHVRKFGKRFYPSEGSFLVDNEFTRLFNLGLLKFSKNGISVMDIKKRRLKREKKVLETT